LLGLGVWPILGSRCPQRGGGAPDERVRLRAGYPRPGFCGSPGEVPPFVTPRMSPSGLHVAAPGARAPPAATGEIARFTRTLPVTPDGSGETARFAPGGSCLGPTHALSLFIQIHEPAFATHAGRDLGILHIPRSARPEKARLDEIGAHLDRQQRLGWRARGAGRPAGQWPRGAIVRSRH
jgi:hypothetical protein